MGSLTKRWFTFNPMHVHVDCTYHFADNSIQCKLPVVGSRKLLGDCMEFLYQICCFFQLYKTNKHGKVKDRSKIADNLWIGIIDLMVYNYWVGIIGV